MQDNAGQDLWRTTATFCIEDDGMARLTSYIYFMSSVLASMIYTRKTWAGE